MPRTQHCLVPSVLAVVASAVLAWPVTARALIVDIDTFRVATNAGAVVDRFDNGMPPPSGPTVTTGVIPYATVGNFAGSEANGVVTLNTANGAKTTNALGVARFTMGATLLTFADTRGLGIDDDITVSGLFGLVTPVGPDFNGYGIQVTDSGPTQSTQQLLQLYVFYSTVTGDAFIRYLQQDFANTSVQILGTTAFAPPVAADQIFLQLSRVRDQSGALTNSFQAFYDYVEGGVPMGVGGTFGSLGAMFAGENYVRGRFFASQDATVPEPATLLLLGIALAGVGVARRRVKR